MDCVEKCGGCVDPTQTIEVRTGCATYSTVHPCNKCGRLHWPQGDGVNNRSGAKAYMEDGKLVNKDNDGNVIAVG